MTDAQFGIILALLGFAYGFKEQIANFINNIFFSSFENIEFKTEYWSYFLFVILSITLVVGMMSGDKIVKNYSNVSDGFENVKPKDMDRPNPLFDIDTYW